MRTIQCDPPDLRNPCRGDEVACVRPMRRGGPRIDTTFQNDVLVTNAYGFGGAGWTLAPGAANRALACFDAARRISSVRDGADVAVVGAGVVGLSVANLLAARPDVGSVTVYAESFSDLTSHHAGGLLAPVSLSVAVGSMPWLCDVAVKAFRDWAALAERDVEMPWQARGARFMDSYQMAGRVDMDAYRHAGVMAPEPVVLQFGATGPSYDMIRWPTLFMNAGVMMQRMHSDAARQGVVLEQGRVTDLATLDAPWVFNCAGLGGGALAGESDAMVPVLGHMLALKNQNNFAERQYMCGYAQTRGQTYYIPKIGEDMQGVLGGTFCEGVADKSALPQSFDGIWERGKTFFYGAPRGRDWFTGPR